MKKNQWCRWGVMTAPEDGVIVGCSRHHEWMLPWWWMHFRPHNPYPVVFFNFGDMSLEARKWCAKRGELKTLMVPTEEFVATREDVPSECVENWEKHDNMNVWKARLEWFKKPFACLMSPFKRTIWIDLDCQVRKSLKPIFKLCKRGLFLCRELPQVEQIHRDGGSLEPGEIIYNTGVIPFLHGEPLIENWARECVERNRLLRGDQEVLSRWLFENGMELPILPSIYNFRVEEIVNNGGVDSKTVIIHWLSSCKQVIEYQQQVLSQKGFGRMELTL